jgi:hypothetical protein
MSQWPPPPDLASIKELTQLADTEEFIIRHGAPADEYGGEAEDLFQAIGRFPTSDLTTSNLLPIIERIWSKSFDIAEDELPRHRHKLLALAQEIERFFGPAAQPQTRQSS